MKLKCLYLMFFLVLTLLIGNGCPAPMGTVTPRLSLEMKKVMVYSGGKLIKVYIIKGRVNTSQRSAWFVCNGKPVEICGGLVIIEIVEVKK